MVIGIDVGVGISVRVGVGVGVGVSVGMDMVMAGVVHHAHHHLLTCLHQITSAHLLAIGAGASGGRWCEQLTTTHQAYGVLGEAKGLFQVVFHHLVVMELQVGRH